MKKPCLARWRLVLVLLLGAVTWWSLGWFLSPRPLYTHRYPTRFDRELERPIDWFKSDPIDQQGRLLLVSQGNYGPDRTDDPVRRVIDLPTGKELVSYQLPEVYQFESGTIRTYHLNHPWFGFSGNVIAVGTAGSSKETSRDCYWEWNLISNQKRLLHYDHEGYFYPSDDGSTVFEQFKFPLTPFQGLLPGNVLGVVTSEMIAHNSHHDIPNLDAGVTCRRFWSLPELSKRSTIITPSFVDRSASNLSHDGRWLILYDHFLDSNSQATSSIPSPFRSPNMMKVYDTWSGELWCEIPAPQSLHENSKYLKHGFSVIYPVVHERNESDQARGKNRPKKRVWRRSDRLNSGRDVSATSYLRYFHIPTKNWLAVEGENSWFQEVPSGESGEVAWLRHSINSEGGIEISVTDQQGHTRQAGFVDLNDNGYAPMLITHSTQMVFQQQTQSKSPEWMVELVSRFNWLAKWLNRQPPQEIIVHDYQRNKTLWRMEISDNQEAHVHVTPTGSFLVVSRLVDDHYEVAVLALPLSDWSRWWARSAGMIVVMLLWYVLRRRKGKLPA